MIAGRPDWPKLTVAVVAPPTEPLPLREPTIQVSTSSRPRSNVRLATRGPLACDDAIVSVLKRASTSWPAKRASAVRVPVLPTPTCAIKFIADRESPPVLGVLVFVVVAAVSLGTAVAMRRRRGVAVD